MNEAHPVIDAHIHLWRYDPADFGWIAPDGPLAHDFAVPDLCAQMDAAGVDHAIAVQARDCEEESAFLLAAATHPRILGVVGWIDLAAPDVADRLAARGPAILGYRHIVQDDPDPEYLNRPDVRRGIAAILNAGLTYDLLVNHAQLATLARVVEALPPGRLVLDHGAKPAIAKRQWQPWADHVAALAKVGAHAGNVWCKVSGLVTEGDHAQWCPADLERYLDHLFTHFGADRIVWGSDWPVCRLAATYGQTMDVVANYVDRHCPQARAGIFGGNAMRAYGLGENP